MSVNPVTLIQIMLNYALPNDEANGRVFTFQRNNLMHVHKETEEEIKRRKSHLSASTRSKAYFTLLDTLRKQLKGRVGKVWVDPKLYRVAIPLETATGNAGFGVLPTGSRIRIPEGKFIRAFTYWKRVNDIDLSCFGLTEDGRQEEFSWRNMWDKQGLDITYSGDQTSGYEGGSEYFDINIDLFKKNHPDTRFVVFCDNVYSDINFSECDCTAGFMMRAENPVDIPWWIGELNERPLDLRPVFDPGTVETSYRVNAKTTFAYLFAIDLQDREMIWLNIGRSERRAVAGTTDMSWLKKDLYISNVFNLAFLMEIAGEVVDTPEKADLLVTDTDIPGRNMHADVMHSWDTEKIVKLIAK